jgi:hypothetical protein
MLSAIWHILSVANKPIMLSVIMLSVIILSVVILNVMAPALIVIICSMKVHACGGRLTEETEIRSPIYPGVNAIKLFKSVIYGYS